jgi:hypothetical protein
MQLPIGQPLYRPFMVVTLTTLAVIAAAVWFLWHYEKIPDNTPVVDKFRELIRGIVIAEFGACFVILAMESKIVPEIVANTVGIIIAFLFGQKSGERNGGAR